MRHAGFFAFGWSAVRSTPIIASALALVFVSASTSHAFNVGPSHPGFDDGTSAPQTLESGLASRGTAIRNIDTGSFFPTIQAAHDDANT